MTERPILFSAPMVRAILDGTKTQTRRIAKGVVTVHAVTGEPLAKLDSAGPRVPCPYGQPGDRLWVRETHAIVPRTAYAHSEGVQQTLRQDDHYEHDAAIYREGWTRSNGGFSWRPSIHMPRWASRITLEVTSVRVERLQDISEADARAEGIDYDPGEGGVFHVSGLAGCCSEAATGSYRKLWEQINGPESWATNPWVWVVEFKRIK